MLTHENTRPLQPARVVVLGAGGFIARAITQRVTRESVSVLGLGRPDLDLLNPASAERLAGALREDDAVVFVSAKAPCKDLDMFQDNLRMAATVCTALDGRRLAHFIYVSSDAVYQDSRGALNESSCAEPSSLHGAMHLSREIALRQHVSAPLTIVRPTLVYGIDDPHNGYGPNRFGRLAASGQDIVLFGEGEEQRDHVCVDDVAELIWRIIVHRSAGVANAVSGDVVSFRTLAEFAAASFEPRISVRTSPRNGPMPHNGFRAFDNSKVLASFPGFRFAPWREGLAQMYAQLRTTRRP
ncbi:MAG TPA: NAD(P)-dependent oxidoreductase [Burkholderiales bacterium]